MKKLKYNCTNPLERKVLQICNSYIKDYSNCDNPIQSFLNDLFYGGCESGIISELCYYKDTENWYKKYKVYILSLLLETLNDLGMQMTDFNWYDKTDSNFKETNNQNYLAWFSFEEIAYKIANYNNIEI